MKLYIIINIKCDVVSALRMVRVLLRLWKQHSVNMRRGYRMCSVSIQTTELRSCVKVEVAVLGSRP